MEKNCKIHGPYHAAKGHMAAKCPQCISNTGVKRLMVVWKGWHHYFTITAPPTCFDGILVVHVTDESMNELLEADKPPIAASIPQEPEP